MDTSNSHPLSRADYIIGSHTVNAKELTLSEWEEILKRATLVVAPFMKHVPFIRPISGVILSDDSLWGCHPFFKGGNATCLFGILPSDGINDHLTDYSRLVPIAGMKIYTAHSEGIVDKFVEEYLLKSPDNHNLWAVLLRTLAFKRNTGGDTSVHVESMTIHGIPTSRVAQRALLDPAIGVKALTGLERALDCGVKKKQEHLNSLLATHKIISSMVDRVSVK